MNRQEYSPLKQNKIVSIDSLHPHPRNYRQHTEKQLANLMASLQRFGQGRSIVAQDGPNGYLIVAGHGIVEAAKQLHYTELRADILPADWTPAQITGYLVADNLHSNEASDDETLLAELLQEQSNAGYDLVSLGSNEESLRQMLQSLGDEYLKSGEREEDATNDELPNDAPTQAKLGDIWQLGRHRIACLNSCDPESLQHLIGQESVHFVWADPPYGINVVNKNGHINSGKGTLTTSGNYAPIIGDTTITTATIASQLCLQFFPLAVHIWWGANHYSNALYPSSCWIVWDKENDGIAFADAELAWCNEKSAVRVFRHKWNGAIKDSEHGQRRVHPTQKPIALCEWAFEKYGNEQDVIFDPFLGSGISVIAAEKMGGKRKVYGCELSPKYIDVIVARWERLTGQTAQLLDRMEVVSYA